MPNDDYIKRSDAIRAFAGIPNDLYYTSAIVAALEKIPAAVGEHVRHGRWIEQEEYGDTYYTCSVCGGDFVTLDGESPENNNMRFCPMCGAKMNKEEDGDD